MHTFDLTLPRAVLFDWDNTLIDSWPSLHEAINAALKAMGHQPWTLQETKSRIRQSLRDSFPVMFGDRWTEARDVFYDHYHRHHLAVLTALPGAERLIRELHERGIYVGIVSNKKGNLLRAEAGALNWLPYLSGVVGSTDAPRDKPARDAVELALKDAPVLPGPEVWFVGDTDIDMECAHGTGCVPILVGDATHDKEATTWPARAHLSGCDDLYALVKRLGDTI